MRKTAVILGLYNHLPEGVSDTVLEDTYQTCYRPFLSTLNRFPEISVVMHFSGCLLKKLENRHPEFFMLLEELIGKRQVELLGGAFYEPILPLIPSPDRLGQIELLTTYLRKSFGRRSRGCWLQEYSWEPWLASTMQTCGIDYSFLLDEQFQRAGIESGSGFPILTEDQGRCVTIFPVFDCDRSFDKKLSLENAVDRVLEQRKNAELISVMMSGESIGNLWKNTGLESPDIVMEQTFVWFRKNTLSIDITTPTKFLKNRRTAGRAYFPGMASRQLLLAINPVRYDYATNHGSLRQAVAWHPCARNLYSKMSYVHLQIGQLRGDKARKKNAAEDLWAAQGADAFWPAPFGGIVDPRIRQAAWKGLIEAEQTTRHKSAFKSGFIYADIDFDGEKEILWQANDFNAYVNQAAANVFILDWLKPRRNLCDVFITDSDESDPCGLFIDYISEEHDATIGNQISHPYHIRTYHAEKADKPADSLVFSADLRFAQPIASVGLQITKRLQFSKKKISVQYAISNPSMLSVNTVFSVRNTLALLPSELAQVILDGKAGLLEDDLDTACHCVDLLSTENSMSLRIETKQDAKISLHKITTKHGVWNPTDQGIDTLCSWNLELTPGETLIRQLDLYLQI
ncbi:MAG: DUF1925 domain-containing protein [Spirochaetes bacterium]|nr:DUF1925 domain-containing protein [Spirochaetota bacterium]